MRKTQNVVKTHWDATFSAIDSNIPQLLTSHENTESCIQSCIEPLTSYYKHGAGVLVSQGVVSKVLPPQVVVTRVSDTCVSEEGGEHGGCVTVVRIEAGDASSPLWCARTALVVSGPSPQGQITVCSVTGFSFLSLCMCYCLTVSLSHYLIQRFKFYDLSSIRDDVH
jgi:hypothetical protein